MQNPIKTQKSFSNQELVKLKTKTKTKETSPLEGHHDSLLKYVAVNNT